MKSRTERRRIEVFDTPSGLGGSHTVEVVEGQVKSECASGMVAPPRQAGKLGRTGTATRSKRAGISFATSG